MIDPTSINHRITTQDLSGLMPDQQPTVANLGTHLHQLVSQQFNHGIRSLTLPSLAIMASFFGCSYLELYDVMQMLRTNGYDYNFSSINGDIEVWQKPHK